jgi:hypothetical protein
LARKTSGEPKQRQNEKHPAAMGGSAQARKDRKPGDGENVFRSPGEMSGTVIHRTEPGGDEMRLRLADAGQQGRKA